jgi:hypothetical protein
MKKIRFWAQPIGDTELTTYIPDEDWKVYQDRLDAGETNNEIFQDIFGEYDFEVGMTRLLGAYEAFDVEVGDCDCQSKKRQENEKNED